MTHTTERAGATTAPAAGPDEDTAARLRHLIATEQYTAAATLLHHLAARRRPNRPAEPSAGAHA